MPVFYKESSSEDMFWLSKIGENPTLEQKQASINLIKELDAKAQELTLPKPPNFLYQNNV